MAALQKMFRLYTGASMPAIGLGTWKSEPHQVAGAVRAALEAGYRHIDGAAIYGNEAEVGQVYKEVFGTGKRQREDVFICSKLWNSSHHPERVPKAFFKTLSDLQLDYLDLYLVHWPIAFKPGKAGVGQIEEGVTLLDTWRAMEALVDAGKVRHIGVSNFTVAHLQELLPHARIKPAVLQIELHPYLPQHELVDFCRANQIHVTAYSSLGSGGSPNLLADPVVTEVAAELGRSPAQVLLQWAVQRGISVIPKSVQPERIKANGDLNFTIPDAAMTRLNGIRTQRRFVDPVEFWKIDVFGSGAKM